MRLDKFLSTTGTCSRTEAKKAIRAKAVTVNSTVAKSGDMQIDPHIDKISFYGEDIIYREHTYIMMNKPDGVVSATDDGKDKTVIDLLPANIQNNKLFPCGRLDKNTLGLILITDDGDLAHELLSPKSHVSKIYKFKSADTISISDQDLFEKGITLADGYRTMPAKIELSDSRDEGYITLKEGKYHQIKRMFGCFGAEVLELKRIRMGNFKLPEDLAEGECRELTDDELNLIKEK